MKEILKKENRTTLIVSIICFVLIAVVATYTYSFFAVTKNNSAIIAGEAESLGLTVVVNQLAPSPSSDLIPQMDDYITSAIIGRQGSCIDDNGNSVCHTYKITVTNANVKTKVNGTLTLDKKQNPNLKWAVYNLDEESVPTLVGDIKSPEEKTIITNEEFTAGETKEFYIVVWISESGMIQTDKGDYSGVVEFITANSLANTPLDKSGANVPLLTDGLIPIMYDESRSTWVKADTMDSTSPYAWYDYDTQKWANAVLIKSSIGMPVINEKNKSVNIATPVLTSYTGRSGEWWNEEKCEPLNITFTTGNTGGVLSLDYYSYIDYLFDFGGAIAVSLNGDETRYSDWGNLCIYDDETEEYFDCELSGSYSAELLPNTDYQLTVGFKNVDNYYSVTIDNINLPSDLAELVGVQAGGCFNVLENKWSGDAWTSGDSTGVFYSDYSVNNNEFVLNEIDKILAKGKSAIGKYMCSNGSAKCTELYQVKEVNNSSITKVDSYVLGEATREDFMNSEAGTEIPEDMILAYYVWIPRYKYKVWNIDKTIGVDAYNAQTTGIDIVFENGTSTTGDVRCTYDFSKTATDTIRNEDCTGTNGESYYTHPAFTFGNDELTGFWMGKYELSSTMQECMDEMNGPYCSGGETTDLTPRILPNVFNWNGNSVDNYSTVIKNMQVSNNIYGLSTDLTVADSHMITNMEWGAVSYLSNSNYGICADNICTKISSYGNFYMGEANITGSAGSTTGNIYGVYDMVAGAEEYVKTDISSSDLGKYITTYAPRISSTIEQASYNITRLGDAIGEIVSIDLKKDALENDYEYLLDSTDGWDGQPNGWYYSYVNAPFKNIKRGGSYGSISYGYIFDVNSAAGDMEIYGTRATLAVLPE